MQRDDCWPVLFGVVRQVPDLTTPRLVLGAVSRRDAPLINAWKNDAEIQLMSASASSHESLGETRRRIKHWMSSDPQEIIHYGIRLQDETLIGFCHIARISPVNRRCELGIVIGRQDLWGQGYAREACGAVLRYCFERLNMNRVGAAVYSNNPRSAALFEGLGFQLEGVARQAVCKQGQFVDEHCYALLRSEWSAA